MLLHRKSELQRSTMDKSREIVMVVMLILAIIMSTLPGILKGAKFDALGLVLIQVTLARLCNPVGLSGATYASRKAARRLHEGEYQIRTMIPAELMDAGQIRVMCFDKTGTLTEESLKFHKFSVAGGGGGASGRACGRNAGQHVKFLLHQSLSGEDDDHDELQSDAESSGHAESVCPIEEIYGRENFGSCRNHGQDQVNNSSGAGGVLQVKNLSQHSQTRSNYKLQEQNRPRDDKQVVSLLQQLESLQQEESGRLMLNADCSRKNKGNKGSPAHRSEEKNDMDYFLLQLAACVCNTATVVEETATSCIKNQNGTSLVDLDDVVPATSTSKKPVFLGNAVDCELLRIAFEKLGVVSVVVNEHDDKKTSAARTNGVIKTCDATTGRVLAKTLHQWEFDQDLQLQSVLVEVCLDNSGDCAGGGKKSKSIRRSGIYPRTRNL
eukprot:GSA25T00026570001.1